MGAHDTGWDWIEVPGLSEADKAEREVSVVQLPSGTIYVRVVRNAIVQAVVAVGPDRTPEVERIFGRGLKRDARDAVDHYEDQMEL